MNVELLKRAAAWVKVEAEKGPREREWDQGSWARVVVADEEEQGWTCGSRTCVAGHVVKLAGWKPVMPETSQFDVVTVEYVHKDGESRDIERLACELLGIESHSPFEGLPHLFDGNNTASDIERIVDRLIEEYA